jgi:GAF domain-containing protein/HAMP domain-containing protein
VLVSSNAPGIQGRVPSVESGTDYFGTPAFSTGQTAATVNDEQRISIHSEGVILTVSITNVVYVDGEAYGYVVGTINQQSVILQYLTRDTFIETRSYLSTDTGRIIAPEESRTQSAISSVFSPIPDAFDQYTGTKSYFVNEREYVGYYAPIDNVPLVIINETPADTTFIHSLKSIYGQGVLLAVVTLSLAVVIGTIISLSIIPALGSMEEVIRALGRGDFTMPLSAVNRHDEIGKMARTLVGTREQIQQLLGELESQMATRVRDVQATQEVSRFAATQRDPQILMDNVVNLVVELFPNIYHAQIFLLNESRTYAVLRASTGDVGIRLLERGHRLEVGSVSVIGQVTEVGRTVITRETVGSDVHRRNEFLPDTRAELAIPLRMGDSIIGALDVQSMLNDSFDEAQVSILQTMSDQITVAIENTRLYQDSMRQLAELRSTNQEMTGRTWREFLNYQRERGLISIAGESGQTDLSLLRKMATESGEPAIGDVTERNTVPFAVPIQLRGQILGAVEWELPLDEFNTDKVLLAEELVNRLAISLDNARLFQESRRAIDRERLVNDIASKLGGQTDIDSILQTAVREVGQALRAPQVNINLRTTKIGDGDDRHRGE